MRLKSFLATILAAVSLVFNVSCSDDDEKSVPAAEAMTGSYEGTYTLTVMGSGSDSPATFVISKVDDATISLTTPEAGEGAMALPSLTIDKLPVSESKVGDVAVYTAKASSVSGTVKVNDADKNYTFTDVVVALNGDKIAINYSLQYGKMPMAMVVAFTGNKK